MGFPRQEYWSGCHFLLQGIFPTQRWNPGLLQADSLPSEPPGKPQSWEGNKSWPKPEWKKRCYYVNLLFLNKEIIFKSIKELKVIVFPVLRKETMGCWFCSKPSKLNVLSRVWLWDPADCSPPASSVHGISQARIQEWVDISFLRDQTHVSCNACLLHCQAGSLSLSQLGSPK